MTILLLREGSNTSLSALVEKSQKQSSPLLYYDLQLSNSHLDLVLLSKLDQKKTNLPSADEGFESDIDSLSILSSDNDSYTTEKLTVTDNKPTTETDSANGSSSSDSDTETTNTENVAPPENKTFHQKVIVAKESFHLVDCVCYTDDKCSDILIFVIKNEALVFKFESITDLKSFYSNFTTLKAIANQKAYGKNIATRFNLLQTTDHNGITHIKVTREADTRPIREDGPTSIITITTPELTESTHSPSRPMPKDVNLRQRVESQLIKDFKYNTINSKFDPREKVIKKSNSIENILHLDESKSNLVNEETHLKKIWNSAEDLLDEPKRPQRRKKGRAPPPPIPQEKNNILSGQFVKVNVNFNLGNSLDKNHLLIKSSLDEPHPKKLESFNLLSKSSLSLIRRPKERQIIKFNPKKLDTTLNKHKESWTNSMPKLLKKSNSKTDSKYFIPMAYRYIDTTQDYPISYSNNPVEKGEAYFSTHSQNISLSNYLRGENSVQSINNRLFGLSSKLKDFSEEVEDKLDDSKWASSDKNIHRDNNLKSVIKSTKEESKKKNNKKVTFSAYTTVQVV
ncbi:uncharacterized protein LOC126880534 [Diabrotica virgifera virgifera]|uniref:Uncharacterized protein LOC114331940 n=1 Tax=Diabrotica virgifera virgifera TaxID=50390 RepID=A0A6P7FMT5_DIAVI|nr:uncharacterized protein LOC126880534 [Diabrotica virgifera virgifera]